MDDTGTTTPARFRIPEHVVFRSFVEETILLNIQTGRYHGLNLTAGRMLELLGEGQTADAVAAVVSSELSADAGIVRRDVDALCRDLVDRGLLVRDG